MNVSDMNVSEMSGESSNQISDSLYPHILLASSHRDTAELLRQRLIEEGFAIDAASGYHQVTALWQQHRHPVILLDVSSFQAAEEAVCAALSIKRHDSKQFVGYLADPILRTSGLAGDAIFTRSPRHLPQALRAHFAQSLEAKAKA
jgi:PleD family two-component response regulator